MSKLSESCQSKTYLENKYMKKSEVVSTEFQEALERAAKVANEKIRLNNLVYNQSNAHSKEILVCEESPSNGFVDNLDKNRRLQSIDCFSLEERSGAIEDYSESQEQEDLMKYKRFINSSAYDDVKEAENEIEKKLEFSKLRRNNFKTDN